MRRKLWLTRQVLAIVVLGVLVSGYGNRRRANGGKKTLRIVATEIQSEFVDLVLPDLVGDECVLRGCIRGRDAGVAASAGHPSRAALRRLTSTASQRSAC